MLDLGQAIVLGLVLVGLTQLAMTMVKGPNQSRIVAGVSLLVAFVGVQLVAASDFANDQVILKRPLNSMNFWSQLVVALLAAGAASGVWQVGAKFISNIGQNQPPKPTVRDVRTVTQAAPTDNTPPTA